MPDDYEIEISPEDDRALAGVQAASAAKDNPEVKEGVVTADGKVELLGRKFKVADKTGVMAWLKFAAAAEMSTTDPRALSALYSMLKDCIDAGDWAEFEQHAIDSKAEPDELLDVITKAAQVQAGRPTKQPSSSSAGRRGTQRKSTAISSGGRGKGSKH